jgi:hypothetical protein
MQVPKLTMITLIAGIGLVACTKNSNPKTIYDTVIVTKTDTLKLPPPDDTPNLTNGLVLYLPFSNGSMADSSGGGNTVSAFGGATLGYDMHGYPQSAYTGNGDGSYLLVSNNGSYALDTAFSLTLDFMIRTEPYFTAIGSPGLEALASLVDPSNGYGPTFSVGMTAPGNPQYLEIGVDPATNNCGSSGGGSPNNLGDLTNFAPQVGAWYNLIVTFSSGVLKVYINGQVISSDTAAFSSMLFCSDANLVVGGWWSGDPESINGEIEQVRLYNRTLTAQQIAWLSRNFQVTSTRQRSGLQSGKATTVN